MLNFYYCDLFKCIMLRHIYRDITAKIEIQVKYSILITKTAILRLQHRPIVYKGKQLKVQFSIYFIKQEIIHYYIVAGAAIQYSGGNCDIKND